MDMSVRSKCKEMAEALVNRNSSLILVRGHYICSLEGKVQHWWAKTKGGEIIDPTSGQFHSNGTVGKYVEFGGVVECECCKMEIEESKAVFYGRYGFCSDKCISIFLGLSKYQKAGGSANVQI